VTVSSEPRRRLPRAERGQQLLDVAEKLFVTGGYEQTSIEDVARAAGVSRPIVYDHYGSKEGLYVACVKRAREEHARRVEHAVAAAANPRDQIRAGGAVFFEILEEDPARWTVLFGGSAVPLFGELGARLTELRSETVAQIARLMRTHAPDADPERLDAFAFAVSGVGEQLGRWWLANPDVPRDRVVEHYTEFIWNGLRPYVRGDAQ
jgi:AcrR family transcriptional regulator